MTIDLQKGTVELVPYDSKWVGEFMEERDRLVDILPSEITKFEHVGSTSIPGMDAKPIIDFMAAVKSIEEAQGSLYQG